MAINMLAAAAEAKCSPTLQEGLYLAYQRYLSGLDDIEGVPGVFGPAIRSLLDELRDALGLDDLGKKTAVSTLTQQHAREIITRLEVLGFSAAALANRA
jgi:hypothetical protein